MQAHALQVPARQGQLDEVRRPATRRSSSTAKAPDGCPAGSRIGKGTSVVWARPIVADPIPVTVDVFNGPAAGSGRTLLFLARSHGAISTQMVLHGVLRRTTGRYGFSLDVAVAADPDDPAARRTRSVVSLNTLVQARRAGVSYLEAPRTCPTAGFPVAGTFDFADGSSTCASARIPCTLVSVPARSAAPGPGR